jgi:hypothetical protein
VLNEDFCPFQSLSLIFASFVDFIRLVSPQLEQYYRSFGKAALALNIGGLIAYGTSVGDRLLAIR